jgi:hypothetical protein
MKTKNLFGSLFTTVALTACGGFSLSSNPTSSALTIEDSFNQPNRTMLRSLATMLSNPGRAMRTNLNINAEIYSEVILPNYQTSNTFQIAASAELAMNTPETGNGNAELNINVDRFALLSSISSDDESFTLTDETVVENQTANLYIEEGLAYVNLSEDATTIARLLFPSANREFPTQFKTPLELEDLTGNFIPQLTEENIDRWVETSLPMVDSLNLLNKTLTGSTLSIRYEITQEDLPAIYEQMYLGTITRDDLNEEDNLQLDQWIEASLAAITLNQFQISFSVNLMTNLIEGLSIDIDVDNQYSYELIIPIYDPENPEADEDGFIESDPFTLEWSYNYAFEINAQMEVLTETISLIAPINKEEYELIELNPENPNLF